MPLQPRPWLAGLLPVALLAAASLWWKQTEIERDLARRAGRALAQTGTTVDGKPWPKVAMVGRDAVIQGTAPSIEAREGAARAAGEIFGVRQAAVAADLLPLADPFGWSARREAASLILTGQVAPDGSRERLVLAARSAVSGAEVVDQMVSARGVPAVAAGAAAVGIVQLGRMASGAATLVGSTFSLSGMAADETARSAVEAGLSGLPAGVARGAVLIKVLQPAVVPEPVAPPPPPEPPAPPPPPPPPPVAAWSAIKTATGITLSGTVASEAARERLVAAAQSATTGEVVDRMTIAPGLAEAVETKAIAALQQIGLLATGTASLTDKVYSLTGIAASAAAFETMAGTRDSTDDFTIGELAIAPPAVSPFLWGVVKRDGVLTLSGYAPSAAAKASVLALTAAAAGRVRIVDEMKIASGLAEGVDFPALVAFALGQVARLDEASAELRDTRFLLTGRAADFETATAVRQAILGLGAPLRGEADIALPAAELPAPAEIPDLAPELVAVPPAVIPVQDKATDTAQPVAAPVPAPVVARPIVWPDCTSVITTALEGDRILFDYWKAEQRAEHAAVLDRLAAGLRRCNPAIRVEVGGHTDIRNLSQSNQRLSEDRAGVIREALIRRGIGGEMLVVKGYAAERPVVPNDSETNMALNRRVEFTVLAGP